jgi:hypothetical protein
MGDGGRMSVPHPAFPIYVLCGRTVQTLFDVICVLLMLYK